MGQCNPSVEGCVSGAPYIVGIFAGIIGLIKVSFKKSRRK